MVKMCIMYKQGAEILPIFYIKIPVRNIVRYTLKYIGIVQDQNTLYFITIFTLYQVMTIYYCNLHWHIEHGGKLFAVGVPLVPGRRSF
jgi:hypothetical protein